MPSVCAAVGNDDFGSAGVCSPGKVDEIDVLMVKMMTNICQ